MEYEIIGLPSLTAVFAGAQLNRLTFQWILATAVSLQLFTFYGLTQSPLVQISFLAASLWLALKGMDIMREYRPSYTDVFRSTNYFMIAVMFLIFFDKLANI